MEKLNCAIALAALSLTLSACTQQEDEEDCYDDTEGDNVNLTIYVTDFMQQSRSDGPKSSSLGGVANVDMSVYDLRYQIAVYRIDSPTDFELVVPATYSYCTNCCAPANYSLSLPPNNDYRIVVWADFVRPDHADLHYDTSTLHHGNKPLITEIDNAQSLNDESRDAYFASTDIHVDETGLSREIVLQRPFAKLRIVTTDFDEANAAIVKPDNFKVTYRDCQRFSMLNLLTGETYGEYLTEPITFTGQCSDDNAKALGNIVSYNAGVDDPLTSPNCRTLTIDYILAPQSGSNSRADAATAIHLQWEALSGDTSLRKIDLSTDIPIRSNWLTTLTGNLLSVNCSFNISIDEQFAGEL